MLVDPDTNLPFYVGIGTHNRPYFHVANAKKQSFIMLRDLKTIRILKLLHDNKMPIITILETNMTCQDAQAAEIKLIAKFGRLDRGTGILTNRTDGGQWGIRGEKTKEWKLAMSEIQKIRQNDPITKMLKSKAMTGQKRTAEQRDNIAKGQLNISDAKRKMTIGGKNPAAKRIMVFGQEFSCIRDAEHHFNLTRYFLKRDPSFMILDT
jgi:hypothetical protein